MIGGIRSRLIYANLMATIAACAALLVASASAPAHTKRYPTKWESLSVEVTPDTGSGWSIEGLAQIKAGFFICEELRFWDLIGVYDNGSRHDLDGGLTSFNGWIGFGAQGPPAQFDQLEAIRLKVRRELLPPRNAHHRHICRPTQRLVYQVN